MRSSGTTNGGIKSLLRRRSAVTISYKELVDLTSRVFAESMTNLNRYQAELDAVKATVIDPSITGNQRAAAELEKKQTINKINENISLLKKEYNTHFDKLVSHITENSQDIKSQNQWLNIAKACEIDGNDMLGYAIRNVFSKLVAEKKLNAKVEKSELYQHLKSGYFETFFSSGSYKQRVSTMKSNAVSPSLQFYFTIADSANTREDDYKSVKKISDTVSQDEWKKAFSAMKGKSEAEDKESIQRLLSANHKSKEQVANEMYSVIQKYKVDSYEKLQGLFSRVNDFFDKQKKGEIDPFFERYRSSTNSKLVNNVNPLMTSQPSVKYTAPQPVAAPLKKEDENFKLLTPHDMNRLYAGLVNSSDLRNKTGLIKEFRTNISVLAEGHTASKAKMNNTMPVADQIHSMLSEQKFDHDNLKREMKYAEGIQSAIVKLATAKNIDQSSVNKLIASFNEQLKRLDKNATILGDEKSNRKIREMMFTQHVAPEQSVKIPAAKQSTAEKRAYLTKTRAGLFGRSMATGQPSQPEVNEENKNKNRK